MKLDALYRDFQRCGIDPMIYTGSFASWQALPRDKGCYSIWQDDICIYVGQAGGQQGFKGRFLHHWNKAYGIEYSSTSHGKGWVAGRLLESWSPDSWVVEYFLTSSAVHRTYLEAAMMLEFDPMCNDETFEDRLLRNQ